MENPVLYATASSQILTHRVPGRAGLSLAHSILAPSPARNALGHGTRSTADTTETMAVWTVPATDMHHVALKVTVRATMLAVLVCAGSESATGQDSDQGASYWGVGKRQTRLQRARALGRCAGGHGAVVGLEPVTSESDSSGHPARSIGATKLANSRFNPCPWDPSFVCIRLPHRRPLVFPTVRPFVQGARARPETWPQSARA